MLRVHQVSKSYGIQPVLENISFTLNRGERLALVGPNGCGKTTLLRILAGVETPDKGSVTLTAPNVRLGYLPQGLAPAPEDTIGKFLGLDADGTPALALEVERLAAALAGENKDAPTLQQQFDRALAQLELADDLSRRAPRLLAGLGLDEFPLDTPARILSGGQKTRLALASALLAEPQLLLLDEPTNHLDLEMLAWLEDWLNEFPGAALLVSHDRAFLDQTATSVLELDERTHTARSYAGNYGDYLVQKQAEFNAQRQAYQDQQDEIERLQAAVRHIRGIARFRKGGKADTGDKFAKGFFANRGKETIRKAKQIEERIAHLQTDEKIDKPQSAWQMNLAFAALDGGSRAALTLDKLSVGYTKPLLSEVSLTLRHGERAALLGPNGCGKTTLLRTIAGRLPPLAGSVRLGSSVRLGYMTQEQEDLNPALNALQTLQRAAGYPETQARAYLHRFLFSGDEVFTLVGSLSYGERARLNLACLAASGCNLLLLDEPLNHLDIPSRVRFEQALEGFEGAILAVVHDRYFLARFAQQLWRVEDGRVRV